MFKYDVSTVNSSVTVDSTTKIADPSVVQITRSVNPVKMSLLDLTRTSSLLLHTMPVGVEVTYDCF